MEIILSLKVTDGRVSFLYNGLDIDEFIEAKGFDPSPCMGASMEVNLDGYYDTGLMTGFREAMFSQGSGIEMVRWAFRDPQVTLANDRIRRETSVLRLLRDGASIRYASPFDWEPL